MTDDARGLAPQDLTLTIFGDYVYADRRPVWSGGLVHVLEDFGFTTASARLALSRLNRRGLIAGTKVGRQTYYELTPSGAQLLAEGQARIFSFGRDEPWDGMWTVLSYSLPEERRADRDRLRKRLSFLGFASLHDGTWISPRDRGEAAGALLAELDLERDAFVFRGRLYHGPGVDEVIARCWDIARLGEAYDRFVDDFRRYRPAAAQGALGDPEAFVVRTRAIHEFKRFPSFDPDLPEEIIGRHWARADAVATFHDVYDGLATAAERHFRSAAYDDPN